MLLWSCKQRRVVVSASIFVLLLIPYIEFKTRWVNTKLDEIFQTLTYIYMLSTVFKIVKTSFKQFGRWLISTHELIIVVPPWKNIALNWHSIIAYILIHMYI